MKKGLCLLWLAAWALGAQAIDANLAVRVTPLMRTQASWDGQPIVYPPGKAEASMLIVEIVPGGETGWHEHAVPSFAYMLAGELEVSLADGRKNRLKAGDTLAEVVGVIHNGRNVGSEGVRILVFYTGAASLPLSKAHPDFRPQ